MFGFFGFLKIFDGLFLLLAYAVLALFGLVLFASYLPDWGQSIGPWLHWDPSWSNPHDNKFLWILGFLRHFRVQFAIVSLVFLAAVVPIYILRMQRSLVANLFMILLSTVVFICVLPLIPYYLPVDRSHASQDTIKILHFNVLAKNRNTADLTRFIQQENPDIISLQEYSEWWQQNFHQYNMVLQRYPYRYITPYGDDAVYSKRPLIGAHTEHIAGSPYGADASIVTRIKINHQPITFLFSHPPTPMNPPVLERQARHFQFWAKNRGHYGRNWILVGNLNTTPWTSEFQNFIKSTNLQDSQLGFGVQASFPTFFTPLMIPVDHCLVSDRIVVLERHLGPNLGSDHLPIVLRLAMKHP
jgi:endonuclease/exonuclease/phosphatase (EEP) superfamily protein YafD